MKQSKNYSKSTLNEWIDAYLKRGFGSMNKNDFEVFIFSRLLSEEYAMKSDYEISIALKMPISKVKRLRYECSLKYPCDDCNYNDKLMTIFDKIQLRNDGKQVIFIVEDVATRQYVADVLKKDGRVIDSSFNTEIVKLYIDDFVFLVQKVYDVDYQTKIEREALEVIKEPLSFDDIIRKAISGAASKSGGLMLNLLLSNIPNLLTYIQ